MILLRLLPMLKFSNRLKYSILSSISKSGANYTNETRIHCPYEPRRDNEYFYHMKYYYSLLYTQIIFGKGA